jgi:hypothetical protein
LEAASDAAAACLFDSARSSLPLFPDFNPLPPTKSFFRRVSTPDGRCVPIALPPDIRIPASLLSSSARERAWMMTASMRTSFRDCTEVSRLMHSASHSFHDLPKANDERFSSYRAHVLSGPSLSSLSTHALIILASCRALCFGVSEVIGEYRANSSRLTSGS